MSSNGNNKNKSPVVKRDERGRWLPGSCPNPAGRPPDILNIKREIAKRTDDLEKVWDWLADRLDDKNTKDSIKLKATELLLAYAYGKPIQVQVQEGRVINISVNKKDTPPPEPVEIIDIEDL